jgi:hypothetical protein
MLQAPLPRLFCRRQPLVVLHFITPTAPSLPGSASQLTLWHGRGVTLRTLRAFSSWQRCSVTLWRGRWVAPLELDHFLVTPDRLARLSGNRNDQPGVAARIVVPPRALSSPTGLHWFCAFLHCACILVLRPVCSAVLLAACCEQGLVVSDT